MEQFSRIGAGENYLILQYADIIRKILIFNLKRVEYYSIISVCFNLRWRQKRAPTAPSVQECGLSLLFRSCRKFPQESRDVLRPPCGRSWADFDGLQITSVFASGPPCAPVDGNQVQHLRQAWQGGIIKIVHIVTPIVYDVKTRTRVLCMRLRFGFGIHDTLSDEPDRSHGNARFPGNFGIWPLPVYAAPINLAAKPWRIRRQFPVSESFSASLHQEALAVGALRRTAAISIEARIFLTAYFAARQYKSNYFNKLGNQKLELHMILFQLLPVPGY